MTAGQGARDSGGRSVSNRIQASSEGRPEASGTISSSSDLNSVVPVSSQCGSLHRVVAELRPQPLHKRANQSPVRAAVPNSSAQRVVGHHATGVERGRERQFELPRVRFHVFTIHRDPAAGLIDRQRAQLDRRSGRRTWARRPAPAPGHCGSGSGWPPGLRPKHPDGIGDPVRRAYGPRHRCPTPGNLHPPQHCKPGRSQPGARLVAEMVGLRTRIRIAPTSNTEVHGMSVARSATRSPPACSNPGPGHLFNLKSVSAPMPTPIDTRDAIQ